MIMKFAALALLYLTSAVSANTCYIIACASSVGSACGVTNANSSPAATVTTCTGTNQYCNTTGSTTGAGVCANQLPLGASCMVNGFANSALCASEYCNANNVCANGDQPNGAKCVGNNDCDSSNCVNSVCTGASSGQACTSDDNCNIPTNGGLYCGSGNTCQAQAGLNAACSSSVECSAALYCSTTTNKCTVPFSGASGAACNDDSTANGGDNDIQCGDGLTCVGTKCAGAPASSGSKCEKDTDCTNSNEYCSCNFATGYGTCQTLYQPHAAGVSALSSAVTSCYNGACSGSQNGACVQSKCSSLYCSSERYGLAQSTAAQNNLPACARVSAGTLPSQCNSASSVAISAVAVVAAVAALMM